MMPPFEGFDWDEGNRAKCTKHGLSVEQIESVFCGSMSVFPDLAHSVIEARYYGIGHTEDGRHVLAVFTYRQVADKLLLRPISARFMHAKEITHYEIQTESPPKKT